MISIKSREIDWIWHKKWLRKSEIVRSDALEAALAAGPWMPYFCSRHFEFLQSTEHFSESWSCLRRAVDRGWQPRIFLGAPQAKGGPGGPLKRPYTVGFFSIVKPRDFLVFLCPQIIFLEPNKGSLDPMVPCCNTYRALIVSKPQEGPFWFLVVP